MQVSLLTARNEGLTRICTDSTEKRIRNHGVDPYLDFLVTFLLHNRRGFDAEVGEGACHLALGYGGGG